MAAPPIVTFTTDFGLVDTYVAQMKGAAWAVHPELVLVDLCHHVPSHDVAAGAYLLETGYAAFPAGTIHVAVVDPGVGTERPTIAVETQRYVFVAPDNGLLERALALEGVVRAHRLEDPRYQAAERSPTFDGRDVLAPAAAWIGRGIPLGALGPPVADPERLAARRQPLRRGTAFVPVLHVDRFGNVVLDVRAADLQDLLGRGLDELADIEIDVAGTVLRGVRRTYGQRRSEPILLVNSAGYLELAVPQGRAADVLRLERGARARLTIGARALEGA